ncbi:hypothetical protein GS429_18770 [Natronorubrum sp. JWXQ-INN-674]|uniref:Uncharacterized protein n=1 Tax=Natronorubrum halalkaliphilum TaxID=2691917 RepID=A0A6B0VR04_9EURY|nr:hypothetical protein [Natronorubrum halalkaliphilum]MXV64070.1 hypothetical protein [Natronorubrum halalkaliphilum]
MGYLNWQCRLYGHDWRHPWNHEVVVTGEREPVYPLRCPRCESVRLLDRDGVRWRSDDENGPSVDDRALEIDPERRR